MDTQTKIKALFPKLKVETFYLHLDGTFEPISWTERTFVVLFQNNKDAAIKSNV